MKRIPRWYWAVLSMVVVLFAGTTIFYKMGATGVRKGGAKIDFGRKHDVSMFRINDDRAFLIGSSGFIAVVKYKPAAIPFCWICGAHERAGSVVNVVKYRSGDFVYTAAPGGPFADAFNLKTGETLKAPERKPGESADPKTVPLFKDRGFTADASQELTPAMVASQFEPLSTLNESCFVFSLAFLLVLGVWLVVGIVLLARRRRA